MLAVAVGALSAYSTSAALILGGVVGAAIILWLLRAHYLVVLMVVVWYLPPQTGPGGIFESMLYARWVGVLLVPLLAAILIVRSLIRRRGFVATPIIFPVLAVLGVTLLSSLINRSDPVDTLTIAALYLRYPILFIALANTGVPLSKSREVVRAFLILTAIQIPEIVLRFAVLGVRGDTISLTLGPYGTLSLGVYCTYAMCIIAGAVAVRGVTLWRILALCVFMTPALLGEIRALLFLAPLSVGIVLLLPGRHLTALPKRFAALLVLLAVAISLYGYWSVANPDSGRLVERLVTQVTQLVGQPDGVSAARSVDRLRWTVESTERLIQLRLHIFGAGPGSGLAGGAASAASAGATQLTTMLWDIGFVGIGGYVWLLISALWVILKALKSVTHPFLLASASAMVGMWIFYAVTGPNYDQLWRYDMASMLFWVLLAGLYSAIRRGPDAADS